MSGFDITFVSEHTIEISAMSQATDPGRQCRTVGFIY